jgi:hypothetical protein
MPLIEMRSTREENSVILPMLLADRIAFVTFDGRPSTGSLVRTVWERRGHVWTPRRTSVERLFVSEARTEGSVTVVYVQKLVGRAVQDTEGI